MFLNSNPVHIAALNTIKRANKAFLALQSVGPLYINHDPKTASFEAVKVA